MTNVSEVGMKTITLVCSPNACLLHQPRRRLLKQYATKVTPLVMSAMQIVLLVHHPIRLFDFIYYVEHARDKNKFIVYITSTNNYYI